MRDLGYLVNIILHLQVCELWKVFYTADIQIKEGNTVVVSTWQRCA